MPQRSTEDAINVIVKKRNEILEENKFGIFISLDVAGAFDAAWWSRIIVSLKNMDIPSNLITMFQNYFSNRRAKLPICGTSAEKALNRGCPQGAKCSPLLWNIYYDNLLKLQLPTDSYIQAFADDAFLIVTCEDIDICELRANKALEIIAEWGRHNKLHFNPTKTQAMVISRRKKLREINIEMDNIKISTVKYIKYLGVLIENKNQWNKHIDLVAGKTRKIYHQLLRTSGKEWGMSGEILRTVYTAAIEPVLTYACSAWEKALDHQSKRNKLRSIQRSFALSIIKGYRTISTEASLILANIDPIDLKIKYCSDRYKFKKRVITDNPSLLNISFQFPIKFASRHHPAYRTKFSNENCSYNHIFNVFTDGSKIDGQTGCAFVAYKDNHIVHKKQQRLANGCTVFQAELLAIHLAVVWILNQQREAIICSDSESALKAIECRDTSNSMAIEIRSLLQSSNHHICLKWVKAHIGIEGNEKADTLAKEASQIENISFDLLPLSYAMRIIRAKMDEGWNNEWSLTSKGRTTAAFFPSVRSRKQCRFIPTYGQTQLLSGHGKFASYLERFKILESDVCWCGQSQTAEHLLLDCPATAGERTLFEYRIGGKLENLNISKKDLAFWMDFLQSIYNKIS